MVLIIRNDFVKIIAEALRGAALLHWAVHLVAAQGLDQFINQWTESNRVRSCVHQLDVC